MTRSGDSCGRAAESICRRIASPTRRVTITAARAMWSTSLADSFVRQRIQARARENDAILVCDAANGFDWLATFKACGVLAVDHRSLSSLVAFVSAGRDVECRVGHTKMGRMLKSATKVSAQRLQEYRTNRYRTPPIPGPRSNRTRSILTGISGPVHQRPGP